jgi:tol-pal system beta propeller repeat protein TolB
MNRHTFVRVAHRAIPAAATAALSIACSDDAPSTAPVRVAAQASTAVGLPNGNPSAKVPGVGQIVFVSNRDANLELYIAADTANAVAARLTNPQGAQEMMPAWAPYYEKVAFASDRDGNLEIYSMKTSGGAATRLTNHPAHDGDPVYSPDGSKIAFTSYRDGNAEIYVMDADGKNVKRLTVNNAEDREPTWSPDGTKIAFASNRGQAGMQIYIMGASDGAGVVQFSPPTAIERAPHWSPDGERIAFLSKSGSTDVVWREVNKTRTAAVSHTVISGSNSLGKPNWSRDGMRVAFHMLSNGQTYVVMDAFKPGGILFQGVTAGYSNLTPVWSR